MMYGYNQGLGYGGMMGGGWLGVLLFFFVGALIIAGVVVLVMNMSRHSAPGHMAPTMGAQPGHDEAVAIAKKRFASGEITKDQYDELMRTLAG